MNRSLTNWKVLRRIALIFLLTFPISTNVLAAEFGIGISIDQHDQTIYIPFKLTNSLKTEISIGIHSGKTETSEYKFENDRIETGIGVFLAKNVNDKTKLFMGCRFLYIEETNEYKGNSLNSSDVAGYGIAPTLGFEFFVTDHISLGGEAEFYYKDLNGEDEDKNDIDNKYNGTDSRVVLRYYFN